MGPPLDSNFPTPWPDESDFPGFRQYMESQYEAFQNLALKLMRAVEMGAQVPEGAFTEKCVPDASELRLNHYPAIASQDLDVRITRRTWPHTDTGLFSFIFQGNDGLQIDDRKSPGRFIPVLREGTDEMLVIVANTLERWTNGNLRACVHTVLAQDDRKSGGIPTRRSTIFFFRAGGDKSAGPLPQFVSASQPARYDEIKVSEYNQQRNALMYG
jgi:isopenicillin N synthase-like dioxygenase